MTNVKVGVFLSECGGQLQETLNLESLVEFTKEIPDVVMVERNSEFWRGRGLKKIVDAVERGIINRVVVSEASPKLYGLKIIRAVEKAGLNPYLVEVIDLNGYCAIPHSDAPEEATEKAKAMLLAAIEKAKLMEPIEEREFQVIKSALVIGGGVAGIQAAMDLAELGFNVFLIEKTPFLGGLASKAGKFFPTDDCAVCIQSPTKSIRTITSTSRKCIYRSGFTELPNLRIFTNSKIVKVEGEPGNWRVTIEKKPRFVNELKCISCGVCTTICPVEVPDEYNANLTKRKAIYMNIPCVYPPVYVIDPQACKFNECAKCVDACPTSAIELNQRMEYFTINVGCIIVATGFREFNPNVISEYHYGEYPDVITNLELARMLDDLGPTNGKIIRLSNRKPAKKIVMIQCVGSRDRRYNSYCSGICCMISLKHAILIKEADPTIDVTICYIDIRTTGRGHENYYEKARMLGVKFIKGRPAEVTFDPESGKIMVDVEDALLGRLLRLEADLVVLATAMIPAEETHELAETLGLELDKDGFFKEYNAKLRPTETKVRGIYICGGATFPKDVPTTSLHAHSAAVKAAKFMITGKITKDLRVAVVDESLCGDCEFCTAACPYGAISLVPTGEEHFVAKISEILCEGCGICVGTCPLNAIDLKHVKQEQINTQIRALLSMKETSKPLVLAICCSECGHAAVDSSSVARINYPASVRVMTVPCTGIIQVHNMLEAFKAGAQGVMIIGCKEDGCQYDMGSQIAKRKVEFAKLILKDIGIEPERLEMFNMIFAEGRKFAETAREMVNKIEKLGPIKLYEI